MDFLDTSTVLMVSAVFHAMAAMAWLLLAQAFRIAPSAGRLMAAAHVTRIVAQGCGDCLGGSAGLLTAAFAGYGTLASLTLLLLALRRMLRSRVKPRDILALTAVGAAVVTAGLALGATPLLQTVSAAVLAAMAVLAMREVLLGVTRQLSRTVRAFMLLPFAVLAAVAVLNVADQLASPGGGLAGSLLPAAWRAVLWFLLSAAITISLISLMIWRLVSRIQHLMHHDALTGTLNRRAFERAMAGHQALLQRGQGFAIVMMDIDHFKRVNDAHGHAAGDQALRHAVRLWRAELREVDVLGRLGGEEFCALLPLRDAGDLAGAALAAERMRAALAAAPLFWQGNRLPLTASFGVALPQRHDAAGDAGLARADAQVYRAKSLGRNRVCVAGQAAAA